MTIKGNLTGIQHIGLPVENLEKTEGFYIKLGFESMYETKLDNGQKVKFLGLDNLVLEIYEEEKTVHEAGAWDHVAINVRNIEEAYEMLKQNGYRILEEKIKFLPFWERGVRFFTIQGPDGEKIEFNQIV